MGNLFTPPNTQIYSAGRQLTPDEQVAFRLSQTQKLLAGAKGTDITSSVTNWAAGNVTRSDVAVNYRPILPSNVPSAAPDQSGRINALLQVAPGYTEHKETLEAAIKAFSPGGEFSLDKVAQSITQPQQRINFWDLKPRTEQSLPSLGFANTRPKANQQQTLNSADYVSVYDQGLKALNAEYEKLYGVNGTYGYKAPPPPVTQQPGEGTTGIGAPTLLSRYKAAVAARKGTGS